MRKTRCFLDFLWMLSALAGILVTVSCNSFQPEKSQQPDITEQSNEQSVQPSTNPNLPESIIYEKTPEPFPYSKLELLNKHFDITEVVDDSIGRYQSGETWFEVEVEETSSFQKNGISNVLVFFGNYEISLSGERDNFHNTSGYIGIARYVFGVDGLISVDFVSDLNVATVLTVE